MKTSAILGGALVLQLMLALGLFWNGLDASRPETRPLLDFDVAEVDRLVVDDNLGTAEVARDGDGWILPGLHGLPGADSRIDALLAELGGMETAFPVATTAAALERFEVAEDRFGRHVTFLAGDEVLGELYLGTSPGLRQTHIRRGGEEEVHSLPVGSFEFAGDANDWLDKSLLAAGRVTRLEGPDFVVERQDEAWSLADPAEGEALDPSQAAESANALASLRVLRVADSVPALEWRDYTVRGERGSFGYRFAADAENNRYYVARDDREPVFTLAKVDYDRIAKTRARLLAMDEEPTEQTEALEAADPPTNPTSEESAAPVPEKGS